MEDFSVPWWYKSGFRVVSTLRRIKFWGKTLNLCSLLFFLALKGFNLKAATQNWLSIDWIAAQNIVCQPLWFSDITTGHKKSISIDVLLLLLSFQVTGCKIEQHWPPTCSHRSSSVGFVVVGSECNKTECTAKPLCVTLTCFSSLLHTPLSSVLFPFVTSLPPLVPSSLAPPESLSAGQPDRQLSGAVVGPPPAAAPVGGHLPGPHLAEFRLGSLVWSPGQRPREALHPALRPHPWGERLPQSLNKPRGCFRLQFKFKLKKNHLCACGVILKCLKLYCLNSRSKKVLRAVTWGSFSFRGRFAHLLFCNHLTWT